MENLKEVKEVKAYNSRKFIKLLNSEYVTTHSYTDVFKESVFYSVSLSSYQHF